MVSVVVTGVGAGMEEADMCLDCGCGEPNENHGDDRHITTDSIREAAAASEISFDEAVRNIADGLQQVRSSSSSAD